MDTEETGGSLGERASLNNETAYLWTVNSASKGKETYNALVGNHMNLLHDCSATGQPCIRAHSRLD